MGKQSRLQPISIRPAKSADLQPLSRLDIAANTTHPLIAQSFTYPFQALKFFLAHLQFFAQLPNGTDVKLWKRYVEVMSSDLGTSGEVGIEIQKLAVAPQYQRRGIGSRLLKAFLDDVEGRGLGESVQVRASRDAKVLYERFGWRVVREFKLDLKDWGRYKAYVNFEMTRDA
ncbi:hypothetical protein BKA65DRAFT_26892 [Rhexocercosporidium sp. MPI-PUGE-AT-0058]|nr:hypothetical protein BKA65DRAFT_26892 [Rhexocercosporidium sp. MPI-PUGE-AT-0058]